jgi:hypothetical protein
MKSAASFSNSSTDADNFVGTVTSTKEVNMKMETALIVQITAPTPTDNSLSKLELGSAPLAPANLMSFSIFLFFFSQESMRIFSGTPHTESR